MITQPEKEKQAQTSVSTTHYLTTTAYIKEDTRPPHYLGKYALFSLTLIITHKW